MLLAKEEEGMRAVMMRLKGIIYKGEGGTYSQYRKVEDDEFWNRRRKERE